MEANSTDRKRFQLTENDELLGELMYENLLFLNAIITLPNSETYAVKLADFFGTRITVTKNDVEIANLVMNWRGQIVFTFQCGEEFIFKAKGMFYNTYVIENKDGEKVLQFDPHFNWSKFNYSYSISYDKKPADSLFVLLGVYAANYFIASMTGSVSGMG